MALGTIALQMFYNKKKVTKTQPRSNQHSLILTTLDCLNYGNENS